MNKKELNALEKLLVIQEVDLKIRALEIQIEQIHLRSVQEDPVLNKMRSDLASICENLEASASQQSMYENTLEDIRSAIKGLAATRSGAFKPRTRSSTEALKTEEDKLAALIEETYVQIERLKTQKDQIEASIAKRSKEMQAAMQEPEAEVRKLRVKAKRFEKQREEALVGIPIPLLRRYERLQASRSGIGLTVMRNGICDVCRMTMPTGVRFRLLKGEMIDLCPACGRMVAKIENTVSIAELTAREQAESAARRSSEWEEAEEDDREEREPYDAESEGETTEEDGGEAPDDELDEESSGKGDQPSAAKRLAKIKAAGTKRAAEQKIRAAQKSAAPQAEKAQPKKAQPKKATLQKKAEPKTAPPSPRPEPKKPEPKKAAAEKKPAARPVPKKAAVEKKPEPKKPVPKKAAAEKKPAAKKAAAHKKSKPPTPSAPAKASARKSKPAPRAAKKPAKKK